jgi:glycosyltransferase involved in cell wall biosynthesis
MKNPDLRVAMIVGDEREVLSQWERPDPYFGPAPAALIAALAGLEDLELHILCCTRQPLPAPEKIAPNIFYHSVRVPRWGYLKSLYLPAILAIRRRLRAIQPQAVHGQGTEREYALAAAFSGLPSAVTIHGNMRAIARHFHARPFSFHWLIARLETIALRKATGVICNSAYTEEQVRPLARRTWRVPNALAADFFQPPTAQRAGEPVLLNVGHLAVHKNQLELLELAARLHERGLRFRLHFAGGINADSDYGRRFLAALAPAERAGWARHLGILSRAELIPHLDSAHALVHVATEESFGLAVAEALARNLRLFAFRVGGIADIAADLPEATLIGPLDWAALENSLANWLRDGHPPASNTAQIMHRRYSPATIAAAHMAIYRELASAKSAR